MATSDNQQLELLRNKLNTIDNEIINLLENRLRVAEDIAEIKNKLNLPTTDPVREKEIIERLKKLSQNIILKETISHLYENIFALSKTVRNLKKHNQLEFSKIGIIGWGLIGGSIAKALKNKNPKLQIYTLKRKSINNTKAQNDNLIDLEFETLEKLVQESDLIILASSIDSIIPLAAEIKKNTHTRKDKLLVIDVASVKEKIADNFEKLTDENVEFIATHPMSGSEKNGYDAARSTLFINQPWIITSHRKNHIEDIDKITDLIKYLGGNVRIIDPKVHDELVARISHLVFMISTYLFAYSQSNSKTMELAGTGFETTTRLASGSPLMHSQILSENYDNIEKELQNFIEFMQKNKINKTNCLDFFTENKQNRDKFINK